MYDLVCSSYCANFDSINDLRRYLIIAAAVVVAVVVVADYSS